MFKITNINIHLKFRMFNALFNHLNAIKMIIRNNACTSQALVLRACELAFIKLVKYYFNINKSANLAKIDYKLIKLAQAKNICLVELLACKLL